MKIIKESGSDIWIELPSRGQKNRLYLGHYPTAEEAARARDKKAKELFGEFAYLNLPKNT